jgi:hypothetical protein
MPLTTESEARFNTFYHALLDEYVLPRDPHLLHRFKELYLENFEGVAPGESFAVAKLLVPSRLKVIPIKQEEKSALELAPQLEPAEAVRVDPAVGDLVQIEFPDVPEFSKPRILNSLSPDGKTAFVQHGDPRGYPIQWLKIVDGSGTGRYGEHGNWTFGSDGTDYHPDSYGTGRPEGALGPETEHPPFVPFTESEPVTADPIAVGEPASAQNSPEPSAPGTESVVE